jgi:class 3 adenylate cyclase
VSPERVERKLAAILAADVAGYSRLIGAVSHDVERVLADIDADHGDCATRFLRHGVLLVFAAPSTSFYHWRGWSTAGPSH